MSPILLLTGGRPGAMLTISLRTISLFLSLLEDPMRSFPPLLATLAVSFFGMATPGPALQAQEPSEATLSRYQAEKKDEFAAAALELAIPVLGHAYVGDARAGLRPLAISLGGIAVWVVGESVGCQNELLGSCVNKGNDALILLGVGGYLAGRIWGIISAMDLAQTHNEDLRRRLNLTIQPTPSGVGLGLSYATRF